MKANEFVKKFGLDAIKDMLQKYPESTHVTNDAGVFINSSEYKKYAPWFADDVDKMVSFKDLRRLVKSHDFVEFYGGLDKAKKRLSTEQSEPYYNYSQQLVDSLKQAIADVESCL